MVFVFIGHRLNKPSRPNKFSTLLAIYTYGLTVRSLSGKPVPQVLKNREHDQEMSDDETSSTTPRTDPIATTGTEQNPIESAMM